MAAGNKISLTPEYRLRRKLMIGFREPERSEVFNLLKEVLAEHRKQGAEEALARLKEGKDET